MKPAQVAALPLLPQTLVDDRLALRAERGGDRAFLRALYGEQRAAEVAATGWPEAMQTRFLDDQFHLQCAHYAARPATERRIVTRASRPIGRLYLDRSGPVWSLAEIGLVAVEQGAGLGTALLGWLQQATTEAGALGIELQVTRDNPRAARFYARHGFTGLGAASPTHLRMSWVA